MAQRYCTNCGKELGQDDLFCAGCGRSAVETAAVATPETDVDVPVPPEVGGQPGGRGLKRVVRVSRLDKIVGLILAVVVGVPLLLVVMWIVLQFVLGLFSGLLAA